MDDKAQRSKEVSSQERDLLLHKTIEERKGELESPDVETKPFNKDDNNPSRAPGYSPPHLEERTTRKTLTVVNADGELEEVLEIFDILIAATVRELVISDSSLATTSLPEGPPDLQFREHWRRLWFQ